jgi:hypothetical protein
MVGRIFRCGKGNLGKSTAKVIVTGVGRVLEVFWEMTEALAETKTV